MLVCTRSFVRCLLVLLLAGALVGCDMTRTLDLDDRNHEPRLVLQGRFQPDGPWEVQVSRSVGAFEPGRVTDEQFSVTDATVEVFRDDKKLGTLTRDTLNRYSTAAFAPEPEGAYTVRVSAPNLGSVTATDQVPPLPPARLSIGAVEEERGERWRTLRLTIEDLQATQNYYRIRLESIAETDSGTTIRDPQFFRTRNQAIRNEMGESVEIGGERAYTGSKAVFTDALFDGQTYTIDLQVPDRVRGPRDQPLTPTYALQVQALSADTYAYLHTRRLAERTGNNPFASPVDVEGNVEGGYGLMGGINVDTLRQEIERKGRRED